MKLLFDYFPIICFFIAYKLQGIYVATAVTMGACLLQNLIYWLKHHRFEKLHVITMVSVLILGGSTLVFHKAIFIQWKPSIIYWAFAITLFVSHQFTKKNLLRKLLGDKIALPNHVWNKLNTAWIVFFTSLGFLNLYVVYHYDINAWVNFKLFGTLGLTLIFTIIQALYMTKYLNLDQKTLSQDN